jgi:pyrroline-5-carboxylate reductase
MKEELSPRIGFVGGGNMAEALVRGLLESGAAEPSAIRVSEPREERRLAVGKRHGVAVGADNAKVARWADVLVFAVKPSVMPAALSSVAPHLGSDTLAVSIAAGFTIAAIERALPGGRRVIRAMPNTAAIAQAGATAIARGTAARDADLDIATSLFEAVGECVVVPERLLDAVTGLSGSGPAYVMLVIEAMADGGVRAGLPRDVAQTLAAQTLYGAAKLLIETGEHPGVLKDRVTSPGGTTIAGLNQLEAHGVRGAFIDAVYAATQRSKELGR